MGNVRPREEKTLGQSRRLKGRVMSTQASCLWEPCFPRFPRNKHRHPPPTRSRTCAWLISGMWLYACGNAGNAVALKGHRSFYWPLTDILSPGPRPGVCYLRSAGRWTAQRLRVGRIGSGCGTPCPGKTTIGGLPFLILLIFRIRVACFCSVSHLFPSLLIHLFLRGSPTSGTY